PAKPPTPVCSEDCGEMAKCTLRDDGTSQCVCPGSLSFITATKTCQDPAKPPTPVCSEDCGETAKCTLRDDGTSQCVCPGSLSFITATKTCQDPAKLPTPVCSEDCGETAKCTLRDDGTSQCVCPGSFSFITATKTCQDMDPCAATNCPANAVCSAKKNGKAKCECSTGFVKKNGICTAFCKPTCPINAECAVVAAKPTCRCKSGYTMMRKNKNKKKINNKSKSYIKCMRVTRRRKQGAGRTAKNTVGGARGKGLMG
ncbi:unnamed protein product, partial [Closterium sp. NIES-54]